MKIAFHGAASTVTGSKHLFTTAAGTTFLLDCGLFQGLGSETEPLNRHFGFDPSSVNFMILSHAHIDHSGLIPRLVKEGFRGQIFCTPATLDLCGLMLIDSAVIQENDVYYLNKRRSRKGKELLKPLYDKEDAIEALRRFTTVEYDKWLNVTDEIAFMFTDSGHVLGSAAVSLRIKEGGSTKHVFFSADIGRPGDQILRHPEPFPQADFILCESTYGDRIHEPIVNAEERLLKVVVETCIVQKGKLIIPAFSLDRTQEILYSLDKMEAAGKLPAIKVYVDSPLSTHTTQVVESHPECFNEDLREYMKHGDNRPFYFKNLKFISDVEESKSLNNLNEPCIIISASGMAEAGRIKHHIKNNIGDANNTILIVGYCTPSSLGGRLMAGAKEVKIFGEEYQVIARVETIDAYSAHADYKEMLEYLSCQDPQKVEKVFLVHGEYSPMSFYKQRLIESGFKNIHIPEMGEEVQI
ncbi:MAG TPA: MBL fold metallo-hydrolase [Bacteroidia bacterium]|nr:MBL fold metallo-hydrolase [Bacteroidia bacterium]